MNIDILKTQIESMFDLNEVGFDRSKNELDLSLSYKRMKETEHLGLSFI